MKEMLKNIKQLINSAELVYNSRDYTSATILYFKIIFVVFDFILLKGEGRTPKDHSERFNMLRTSYPDLYLFLDKYFDVYRDTYSLTIEKSKCDEVRKYAKEFVKRYKIPL